MSQSDRRHVPRTIPRPDYADHIEGFPASEAAARSNRDIRELSPSEIEKMRVVCRVGVFSSFYIYIFFFLPPSAYYEFPKSCCTSVNEVICHGIPDGYKLQEGDIVNSALSCLFSHVANLLN
jgi:methionyl aminopeptidase